MPTPPGPTKQPLGEHRLAAIVFTDVAGFSARMEKDERQTMQLVARDLKLISQVCKSFGGDVLKNTGDGCLAAFPSVEGAVGSAIKIQKVIADACTQLPADQALHHRIGIHLGDVFFGQGDVLGNGVNIAARLMGEAEPGGICVSQTVYDLVKGRLDVKAVCIGPRELKNIREAVHVYRLVVSALTGDQTALQKKSQRRREGIVVATLLLVALSIAALLWFKSGKIGPARAAASSSQPATAPTTNLSPMQLRMQSKPDGRIDSAESWKLFREFTLEFLTSAVKDDSYVMNVGTPNFRVFASSAPWGGFDDATIEAAAKIHGTVQSSWGLELLSTQGAHKMARVMIAANGQLKVDLTRLSGTDNANRPLNPNDFFIIRHSAILHGDESNTLVIDVRNHQLTVTVNGERIGSSWDITPLGPSTLVLTTEGTQGTVGTFRSLKLWMNK